MQIRRKKLLSGEKSQDEVIPESNKAYVINLQFYIGLCKCESINRRLNNNEYFLPNVLTPMKVQNNF